MYEYSRSNPITFVDYTGLQEEQPWDPNSNPNGYNPYDRTHILSDEQLQKAHERWETTANLVIFAASSTSPDPGDLVGGLFLAGGLLLKGLGRYRKVGGHHPHAKAAFKNHPNYNPGDAFSISQKFMKDNCWNHQKMTNRQRELFKAIDAGKLPNTMKTHTAIAVEALIAGGATRQDIVDPKNWTGSLIS